MSIGDALKGLFGKDEKKEFHAPDVTFIEDGKKKGDNITHTVPITVDSPTERIIIKRDDEYLMFTSKDQIPPELREEIEHLNDLEVLENTISIIVDGKREVYHSIEDVPESVREALMSSGAS